MIFNLILLIQAISAGLQSHYGIVSISNLEMSKGGDCLRQVGAWIGDDVWLQDVTRGSWNAGFVATGGRI